MAKKSFYNSFLWRIKEYSKIKYVPLRHKYKYLLLRMNNTLIDNSEKFLMRDILQQFIGSGKYNHICIATGY